MKKCLSGLLLATLLLSLSLSPALAATVSVNGSVVSTQTETITTALGGTVAQVLAAPGDHLSAGGALLTLETEKVYALQDGIVRLFGQVGDSAETLTERYGAVAYVEPDAPFTLSASTRKAYDADENKIIHPGETVYLRSTADVKVTGVGVVTTVSGSSYTVEMLSGDLISDDAAYIFRDPEFATESRIGRGSVTRTDPIAYTGTGVVAAYAVQDGSHVKKGDVLFETLSGSYAGNGGSLQTVTVPRSGVVASISAARGGALTEGGTVAEFYADEDLRVEAAVSETDLSAFQVGAPVTLSLTYLEDGAFSLSGVVERISRVGTASESGESEEASFAVIIQPDSTENLYYGMNVVVETTDN